MIAGFVYIRNNAWIVMIIIKINFDVFSPHKYFKKMPDKILKISQIQKSKRNLDY